ncbi:hypothetical protein [Clostridium butyricum]|uniref:hypothetical protein n=1 Tax=Clostridium butyricum TaxID=1492 RepID=UPI000B2F3C9F|nr:hypothetical protein [Clostridium butyricum]
MGIIKYRIKNNSFIPRYYGEFYKRWVKYEIGIDIIKELEILEAEVKRLFLLL